MPGSPVDSLAAAVAVTSGLIDGVGAEQWSSPTPCTDWTVRALVTHLVLGDRLFVTALHGGELPAAMAELRRTADVDQLGADAGTLYRAGAERLIAAFSENGVLEKTVTVPLGTVPVPVALHLRVVETLVHGWDVAVATGQRPRFPDALVEDEIAATRRMLADLVPADLPPGSPGRRPFAPSVAEPAGGTPIDRLAALLGREAQPA